MVVTTMMSSHLCQRLATFITNFEGQEYNEIVIILNSYPVVSDAFVTNVLILYNTLFNP